MTTKNPPAPAPAAPETGLRAALAGLLESVDMILLRFPKGTITGDSIRGFLLGEADRARALLAEPSEPRSLTSLPAGESEAIHLWPGPALPYRAACGVDLVALHEGPHFTTNPKFVTCPRCAAPATTGTPPAPLCGCQCHDAATGCGAAQDDHGECCRETGAIAPAGPEVDEVVGEMERLLADPNLWPAPWVAHTFEIDCPCPNGEHCGDTHSCEQVEAPEAYPDSPEHPAAPGHGQCVVQISVPGLESLSRPTAEFIAAARNHLPALLRALRKGNGNG